MPRFGPISRRDLVRALQQLGFDGPYSGGTHQFMIRGERTVHVPNPHAGDIGRDLLTRILRQAGVSREEWDRLTTRQRSPTASGRVPHTRIHEARGAGRYCTHRPADQTVTRSGLPDRSVAVDGARGGMTRAIQRVQKPYVKTVLDPNVLASSCTAIAVAVLVSSSLKSGPPNSAVAASPADTVILRVTEPFHRSPGKLEQDLAIGTFEGKQEYLFGRIGWIAVAPDSSVVVIDQQAQIVRMYDRRGVFRRNIGALGGGPGEYRDPRYLAVAHDGKIVFADWQTRRVLEYAADGRYLRSWSFENRISRIQTDTAGFVFVRLDRPQGGTVRISPRGQVTDTIPDPDIPDRTPWIVIGPPNRAPITIGPVPYATLAFWVLSPEGFFVTVPATGYVIDFRPPLRIPQTSTARSVPSEREHIISIRKTVLSVPIDRLEREEIVQRLRVAYMRMDPGTSVQIPPLPTVKPAIRELRIGRDGSLFVWTSSPSVRIRSLAEAPTVGPATSEYAPNWREPQVVDVYDNKQRYLGRINVPGDLRIRVVDKHFVWSVVRDDLGVESVVRHRIVWN